MAKETSLIPSPSVGEIAAKEAGLASARCGWRISTSCWVPIFFALVSCGGRPATEPSENSKLTVAVAASMRYAFEDLAAFFREVRPDIEVEATYGASGVFYAQILQLAPFDLFLSADTEYPEKLAGKGLAETPFPYAMGRLVVWAPTETGLGIASRGMEALADPAVAKVAIANPQLAPYGVAALAALKDHGVEESVRSKLVQGENVGQAAQFVQSGAAQAGIFAYSLTFLPELREVGDLWLVPQDSHDPLSQAGTILRSCRDREAAEALRDFLLGASGREILGRHGFGTP